MPSLSLVFQAVYSDLSNGIKFLIAEEGEGEKSSRNTPCGLEASQRTMASK
jgi:hypothetical protein